MVKTFCDLCDKEIARTRDTWSVSVDNAYYTGKKRLNHLCRECINPVLEMVRRDIKHKQ